MGSGGGGSLPTLEDIGNTIVDAGAAVITGGYTLTEPGKKDLKRVKGDVKRTTESLTGEAQSRAADRATIDAEAAQKAAFAAEEEQLKKRKNAEKFAAARTRQLSLSNSGRQSTILTSPLGTAGSSGSGGGKTLLGQ